MQRVADWLLRVAVAFSFLYPPAHALLVDPYTWLGYFPPSVLDAAASAGVPPLLLLHAFGVFEALLALWILSGWRIMLPSLAAAAALVAIVAFNAPQFEILFRDLSIAAAALALAAIHSGRMGVLPADH